MDFTCGEAGERKMRWIRILVASWLATLVPLAGAGEMEDRAAITREFRESFDKSDFAAIETRYAQAVASDRRTGSGVPWSDQMLARMFDPKLVPPPLIRPNVPEDYGQDYYWNPVQEKVGRWAAQFPDSVLPAIVLARVYIDHGFAYRGSGMARTVGKEDWPQFQGYVQRAHQVLLSRQAAGVKAPNWWTSMLDVGRLQGRDSPVFQRMATGAMDAFPGHYPIYFAIAHRMLPQWGGSPRALHLLAEEATRRTMKTDGRALYARIFLAHGLEKEWLLQGVQSAKIRDGFDDLVKQYPNAWNRNKAANMLCHMEDKPGARIAMAAVGTDVVPAAWSSRRAYLGCRQWAAE